MTDAHSSGGLPISFWGKHIHKALEKQLYRSTRLRLNTDYQIKYPNECKNVKGQEIHPDAKLRILKDHKKVCQHAQTPNWDIKPRMNRNG